MGIKTDIEYCDSTLNLQMGCNGCELWNRKTGVLHCYAGRMTDQFGGYQGWPVTFEKPALFLNRLDDALRWPDLTGTERLDKPWLNGIPRVIFTDDMGDSFTEGLSLDWFHALVPRIAASEHIYIWLTKRPSRMLKSFMQLGYIPDNFWLMTSVTDQQTADARIPQLLRLRGIGDCMLGLSVEPLLGPVDLQYWLGGGYVKVVTDSIKPMNVANKPINWVIVGGESGPGARPMEPEWARQIRDDCQAADVPFFFKQWGGENKKAAGRLLDGQEWNQMPVIERAEQLAMEW